MSRTARTVFLPLLDDGVKAHNGEMFIHPTQKVLYYKDYNGQIFKIAGSGGGGGGGASGTGNFDDVFVAGQLQIDGAALFGQEVSFNGVKVYGIRDPQADNEAVNLRTLNEKNQAYTASVSSLIPIIVDSNKAKFQEDVSGWSSSQNLQVTQDLVVNTPYGTSSGKVAFTSSTTWQKFIYTTPDLIQLNSGQACTFQFFGAMTNGLKVVRVKFYKATDVNTVLGDVVINLDTGSKVSGTLSVLFTNTAVALWKRFQVSLQTATAQDVKVQVELMKNNGTATGTPESASLFLHMGGFQFEKNSTSTDYNKTTSLINWGRYEVTIPGVVHKKGNRPVVILERQVAPNEFIQVETGYSIESANGNIVLQYPEELGLVDGRVIVK